MTSKIIGERRLNAIEDMSLDERRKLVQHLSAVIARVISEVARMGRLDLVKPLHDASVMLKRVALDVASASAFGEMIAAAARLIRTARNAARRAVPVEILH